MKFEHLMILTLGAIVLAVIFVIRHYAKSRDSRRVYRRKLEEKFNSYYENCITIEDWIDPGRYSDAALYHLIKKAADYDSQLLPHLNSLAGQIAWLYSSAVLSELSPPHSKCHVCFINSDDAPLPLGVGDSADQARIDLLGKLGAV